MKKKTSKITKKGDWTFTKVAALILILITLVVVILAIFPGLRDPLGSLGVLIKGYTDSFKDFRSKPDSVKAQEEATEFNNRITRILEGSGTCEGYKEVQIIYSKAKPIAKQTPPQWEVCVQNKQGNVLTTDTNKYCDKISDAPKQEVSYFLKYIECLVQKPGVTESDCDLAAQAVEQGEKIFYIYEKDSTGAQVLSSKSQLYAPYSPQNAYLDIGECYQRVKTQESLKKAQAAYSQYSSYGTLNSATGQAQATQALQTLGKEDPQWEKTKQEYGGDPIQDFTSAYAKYSSAQTSEQYITARNEFRTIIRKLDTIGFGPDSKFASPGLSYTTSSSLILKNVLANSYYYAGKSQYFADKQDGKPAITACDNQAKEFGFVVTKDSLGGLTTKEEVSAGFGLATEPFRPETDHAGEIVMPTALYDSASCYNEVNNIPKASPYFKLLFDNFNEADSTVVQAIKLLKPKCGDTLHNSPESCNTARQEYFDPTAVTSKATIRAELTCYWYSDSYFANALGSGFGGVCKSCTILLGENCGAYGNYEDTCIENPCGLLPDCDDSNIPFIYSCEPQN